MFFFSLEFGAVFLVFFMLYWSLKENLKVQNILLLLFNYFILIYFGSFYFAAVLFCYTLFIYAGANFIASKNNKAAFLSVVALAILILCFFKYYASFKDGFEALLTFFGLKFFEIDVLLPLGISFYTFASITYLRAVYEAKHLDSNVSAHDYVMPNNPKLENFTNTAIFLSFFPTIVAGPIMRSDFFFNQLKNPRIWEKKSANLIIVLLIFGLVKKILIATYLQEYSEPILSAPQDFNEIELLLGISGFSVWLYCDFSGYVELVSALALMLGFSLPKNFNMPYAARNIKEFWDKWHISLSTFIRDFIYIPLGGSRNGFFLTQVNVLIAFSLSGIWHGSTISFLIWGALHGVGLIILNIARKIGFNLDYVPFLGQFITFLFVTFAWVFFYYGNDLDSAILFLGSFVDNENAISLNEVILLGLGVALLAIYPYTKSFFRFCVFTLYKINVFFKAIIIAVILLFIFGFMPNGIPNFIYAGF